MHWTTAIAIGAAGAVVAWVMLYGRPHKERAGPAATALDTERVKAVDKAFDRIIEQDEWRTLPESDFNYSDTILEGVTSMARMQFWL